MFPFLHNDQVFMECAPPDASHPVAWCATEDAYTAGNSWGECLPCVEVAGNINMLKLNRNFNEPLQLSDTNNAK